VHAITDGELRRAWWHFDFMEHLVGVEGFDEEEGYKFKGIETKPHQVRVIGKIDFADTHPHLQHFKFLKDVVGDDAEHVAKMTIPSPNMFLHRKIRCSNEFYANNLQAYAEDLGRAYQKAVRAFYEAGCVTCKLMMCTGHFWCHNNAKMKKNNVVKRHKVWQKPVSQP